MIELIRTPSELYQAQQRNLAEGRPAYIVGKYDYVTPDGRWYVEQYGGCGGGWSVTDTTGQYVCASCTHNSGGHTTVVRTLTAAKAFISEWSA